MYVCISDVSLVLPEKKWRQVSKYTSVLRQYLLTYRWLSIRLQHHYWRNTMRWNPIWRNNLMFKYTSTFLLFNLEIVSVSSSTKAKWGLLTFLICFKSYDLELHWIFLKSPETLGEFIRISFNGTVISTWLIHLWWSKTVNSTAIRP